MHEGSREPVAYLLGRQAFWSLIVEVTPEVLIPRPETELLIEILLESFSAEPRKIADLGTGSGAISVALAWERPSWRLVATDYSMAALQVAKRNIARYPTNHSAQKRKLVSGAQCGRKI